MTALHALLVPILAVDPVPWARSQMAFTLAFHIILVPLGVSWAAMALIANYRGIKHDDADAMLLAQRWSKYMAVTFAVGAVTGTVLSFEFGLLWPKFMGQWGAAFGVPFAFEGIFFFTEAIFVSIYIFGWRRLKPWTHFWTGVPIAVTGVLGSISVVSANAWMNSPQGVTLDSAGKVVDVDPMGVIFNDAMPLMAAHMVVAAYLVGGFLIGSVYAMGMLRGRKDRYHRMGLIIAFSVAAIATPVQMGVGDALARWVFNEQPAQVRLDRDGAPDQQRRPGDPVRPPQLQLPGRRRVPDPRPGLDPVRPQDRAPRRWSRASTRSRPTTEPTTSDVNVTHLAWDIMIGLGTLLFLLSLWWWATWIFRRDMPQSRWFLRAAASAGDPLGGHPRGRVDGQRGRATTLDRLPEDEGRRRRHRQHRHLDHLRRRHDPLHRPRHHHDPGAADDEQTVPSRRGRRRDRRPLRAEPNRASRRTR